MFVGEVWHGGETILCLNLLLHVLMICSIVYHATFPWKPHGLRSLGLTWMAVLVPGGASGVDEKIKVAMEESMGREFGVYL